MLKVYPKDVAELIRRARRAQGKTLARVARDSGVALATVHRYETAPTETTARVLSVLSVLGFELSEQDGEVSLPLPQALALRRLLHEARQAVVRGDASPRILLALDRVNRTKAGSILVRGLRAASGAFRPGREQPDQPVPADHAAA